MFFDAFIWGNIGWCTLAVAGGLAKQFHDQSRRGGRPKKLEALLRELFVSLFSGIMALLIAYSFGLAGYILGVMCGVCGWTAPAIIEFGAHMIERVFKMEKDELWNPRRNDKNEK